MRDFYSMFQQKRICEALLSSVNVNAFPFLLQRL